MPTPRKKRKTLTLVMLIMLIVWLASSLLIPAPALAEVARQKSSGGDDSDLGTLGREPLPTATEQTPTEAPVEPALEKPALPDPEPAAGDAAPGRPRKKATKGKKEARKPGPDEDESADAGADANAGADSATGSASGPRATSSDDAPLVDQTGEQTTFGEALGGGSRVVVFTKPWADASAQIISELSHYRLRLNRGGLRSGVIFLRAERDEAIRAMEPYKGRVKWWIDSDGGLAKLLDLKTLPALMLIDADGNVKFAAPLLNDELVKQLAKNFNKPETVFRAPRPVASPRVGIPPAKGGMGRYSIR